MSLRERKPLFTKELTTEKYGRREDGSRFERIEIFMKEDVDEAVAELKSKIECEMRRLEKSRDKVNQLEDEVTWRMWDDMISGLSLSFEIIKEVFE